MDDIGGLPEYLRMVAALVFVLGLMGGLALLLKRLGLTQGAESVNSKDKRLNIIETRSLDARRKLVLLSRDDVQHLVIIGQNGETVIETGIEARETETSK